MLKITILCLYLFFALGNGKRNTDITPAMLHLSYSEFPDEMFISWKTNQEVSSVVFYGLSPSNLTLKNNGIVYSYHKPSGYVHFCIMSSLLSRTRYYYKVGSSKSYSNIFSFISAPHSPDNIPFKFLMYGDFGIQPYSKSIDVITSLVEKQKVDFILHLGDLSYANNYTSMNKNSTVYPIVWDIFMKMIEPVTRKIPYMVTVGNHEASCNFHICNTWAKGFTVFNNRFRMPFNKESNNSNMFYSWVFSNTYFISVSTETDYPNSPYKYKFGDQEKWLEKELSMAAKMKAENKISWIIVSGHRPIYSSTNAECKDDHPIGSALKVQKFLEPLFHKYSVDLYLSGHVHSYQRIAPVYQSILNDGGWSELNSTGYIVSGAGGCIEGVTQKGDWTKTSWIQFHSNETTHGVGMLSILSDCAAKFEFFDAVSETVIDQIKIKKKCW